MSVRFLEVCEGQEENWRKDEEERNEFLGHKEEECPSISRESVMTYCGNEETESVLEKGEIAPCSLW